MMDQTQKAKIKIIVQIIKGVNYHNHEFLLTQDTQIGELEQHLKEKESSDRFFFIFYGDKNKTIKFRSDQTLGQLKLYNESQIYAEIFELISIKIIKLPQNQTITYEISDNSTLKYFMDQTEISYDLFSDHQLTKQYKNDKTFKEQNIINNQQIYGKETHIILNIYINDTFLKNQKFNLDLDLSDVSIIIQESQNYNPLLDHYIFQLERIQNDLEDSESNQLLTLRQLEDNGLNENNNNLYGWEVYVSIKIRIFKNNHQQIQYKVSSDINLEDILSFIEKDQLGSYQQIFIGFENEQERAIEEMNIPLHTIRLDYNGQTMQISDVIAIKKNEQLTIVLRFIQIEHQTQYKDQIVNILNKGQSVQYSKKDGSLFAIFHCQTVKATSQKINYSDLEDEFIYSGTKVSFFKNGRGIFIQWMEKNFKFCSQDF